MTTKEVESVLVDILRHELSLPLGRVVLSNQNYKAPNDSGLYIVVGMSFLQIIGSNRGYVQGSTDDETKAEQPMSVVGTFYIEFTSRNTEAIERQGEVIASINSFYSTQQEEKCHIRINRTPQVLDLSFIEGPSALHRFRFEVKVFYSMSTKKPTDNFTTIQSPEVVI